MRKIRMMNDNEPGANVCTSFEGNEAQSFEINEEVKFDPQKIDDFLQVSAEVAEIKRRHKKELADLESEKKSLQSEILRYAAAHEIQELEGVGAKASIVPKNKKVIEPKDLLAYLKQQGRLDDFWNFVSVGITEVVKVCGEAVLEEAGVLKRTVDTYGSVNCFPKRTS